MKNLQQTCGIFIHSHSIYMYVTFPFPQIYISSISARFIYLQYYIYLHFNIFLLITHYYQSTPFSINKTFYYSDLMPADISFLSVSVSHTHHAHTTCPLADAQPTPCQCCLRNGTRFKTSFTHTHTYKCSGKTSLLFQLAYDSATEEETQMSIRGDVIFICSRRRLETKRPSLFQVCTMFIISSLSLF